MPKMLAVCICSNSAERTRHRLNIKTSNRLGVGLQYRLQSLTAQQYVLQFSNPCSTALQLVLRQLQYLQYIFGHHCSSVLRVNGNPNYGDFALQVVIGKGGKDIVESESMDHVAGYALAIDMTARDLQSKAKKAGLPWTHAKGLDTFTPISNFIPKSAVPSPHELNLWLKVDDELRQNGNTGDMVHNIPFLISYVSRIMTLEEGDLIITGTPEGVGPVPAGSVLTAGITGLIDVRFPVETRVYKA